MEAPFFIYVEEEKGRDKWEGGRCTPGAQFGTPGLEKVKMPTEGKKGVLCHAARV